MEKNLTHELPNLTGRCNNSNIIPLEYIFYKNCDNRGFAYILNNMNTVSDTTVLQSHLKELGFESKHFIDPEEFKNELTKDTNDKAKYIHDDCVAIITITENKFSEEELIKQFFSNKCEQLKCKPKLFFFLQISNGIEPDSIHQGTTDYIIAEQADILIYKESSNHALKNLCSFLESLNTHEEVDFIKKLVPLFKKNSERKSSDKEIEKLTVYNTFTRHLMLKKKCINENEEIKKREKCNTDIIYLMNSIKSWDIACYNDLNNKYNLIDLMTKIRTDSQADHDKRLSIAKQLFMRYKELLSIQYEDYFTTEPS
ncbi:uncharacterized protein LOC143923056 [Arctopsyche grandis]|uniref:uncharacterized protein LOC143923056 n=1 Tax=Arctopsyche grandis TaxID=121162 RepID=UPI00406D887C